MSKIKNYSLIFWISLLLIFSTAHASIKISDASVTDLDGKSRRFEVVFSGTLTDRPVMEVKDNFVQLVFKDAVVWPKINKQVKLNGDNGDTTLMVYQFDKDTVRARAVIPYSLVKNRDFLNFNIVDQKIILDFPVEKSGVAESVAAKLDDSYLEKLLDAEKKTNSFDNKIGAAVVDNVKNSMASNKKEETITPEEFSIGKYVAKFVAFLSIVLLLFYGLVVLMKKGVARKGKLGFFNNMNLVTVVNTTHVGPKRNLMVVKVHNQVFLLGSSESGISLISELNDFPGVVKETEKFVTGENFDEKLNFAEITNNDVTLKENILISSNSKKSSFSEQIKEKVKGLKPLQ